MECETGWHEVAEGNLLREMAVSMLHIMLTFWRMCPYYLRGRYLLEMVLFKQNRQDNISVHAARVVRKFLATHPKVLPLDWILRSPDLNPIEV